MHFTHHSSSLQDEETARKIQKQLDDFKEVDAYELEVEKV
jgi:phosphoribosyl 1,2-cyclic phosphodiesterase